MLCTCRYNILFSLQASLIGHMDKLNLLKPRTIFMEFGAGRGKGVNCHKLGFGLTCTCTYTVKLGVGHRFGS